MPTIDEQLIAACEDGDVTTVESTLAAASSSAAQVNTKLNDKTPLTVAIDRGHIEVVKLLLDYGADPNLKGLYEYTPLVRSLQQGFPEIATILLDRGAQDLDGALLAAVTNYHCDVGFIEKLIARGASLEARDSRRNTPLLLSVRRKDIAELLINKGADVNAENDEKFTPLLTAVKASVDKEVLSWMIDKGANVNAETAKGNTALMLAVQEGNSDHVELLLSRGADPNAKGGSGQTALSHAAMGLSGRMNTNIAKVLLDQGADVNARDNWGNTPLTQAAVNHSSGDVINWLVERGADLNAKTKKGQTALDLALDRGCTKNAERLRTLAAKIHDHVKKDDSDEEGITARIDETWEGMKERVLKQSVGKAIDIGYGWEGLPWSSPGSSDNFSSVIPGTYVIVKVEYDSGHPWVYLAQGGLQYKVDGGDLYAKSLS